MKKLTSIISDTIAEMIAPSFRCIGCGKDVFDETAFCPDCAKSVVYNNGKTCKRCGVAIDGAEEYCDNCAFDKLYFDRAYSVFCYDGAVRKAILAMKFNNLASYAKVFAKYLVFLAEKYQVEYDVVTFVPMSKQSLRKRGYNQAQWLARYFCNLMDEDDLLIEALVKTKETASQESLGRTERKTNLTNAYTINADVKGKRVLIIDDVKTTGSTLNECAKVLKKHGATAVYCITIASPKQHFDFEQD